jgi:hypothetical protein
VTKSENIVTAAWSVFLEVAADDGFGDVGMSWSVNSSTGSATKSLTRKNVGDVGMPANDDLRRAEQPGAGSTSIPFGDRRRRPPMLTEAGCRQPVSSPVTAGERYSLSLMSSGG